MRGYAYLLLSLLPLIGQCIFLTQKYGPKPPFLREFRDSHGRFLAGDLAQLNDLLKSLELRFDVSDIGDISGIEATFDFGVVLYVTLTAQISPSGREAVCWNLEILDDIYISGVYDTIGLREGPDCEDTKLYSCDDLVRDNFVKGDPRNYTRYIVSIDGVDIKLDCDLDIRVLLDEIKSAEAGANFQLVNVEVPNWNVDTTEEERSFNFSTTTAIVSQKLFVYGTNLRELTPSYAEPDECTGTDVGDLTFQGERLLVIKPNLADIFGELGAELIDLFFDIDGVELDETESVLEELKKDPGLVTDPINDELCGLIIDLADQIAQFIVDNPLTNKSGDFVISDPFKDDGTGMPALDLEESLSKDLPQEVDLLNLQESNFFVDLLFPEKNASIEIRDDATTLASVLEFFTDPLPGNGTEVDPLLVILSDLLGFNITDAGNVENLDVLAVIYDLLEDIDEDKTLNVVNTTLSIDDTIFIDAVLTIEELFLSVFPPNGSAILSDPNVLGAQTIVFPSIRLGDLVLTAKVKTDVKIENIGDPSNTFLATPFSIVLDELLSIVLEWDNFFSKIAGLFAVDLDELLSLQFGPLIKEIFECLFSSFYVTPKVTGATFAGDEIRVNVTNYDDAIAYLLAEIINVIVPIYQPVLPQVVEVLVQDLLVNATLIEDTTCDKASISGKSELYDFSTGIFKDISDLATVDLFEELFSFIADDENEIQVLPSPLNFSFGLPRSNGFDQNLSFELSEIYIQGILPPVLNEVLLLYVSNTSIYYPQGIYNLVDLADLSQPIQVTADLSLNLSEPVAAEPGAIKGETQVSQQNTIRISVAFTNVRAILDIFAHFTLYSVESMELGNILSIDCWQARLNESGGIKVLSAAVKYPFGEADGLSFVSGFCNCPRNLALGDLIDALSNPAGWSSMLNDVNYILESVGQAIELSYNEENWQTTIENSAARCAGFELESENSAADQAFEENYETALTLIGMVFAGLSATTILAYSSKIYYTRKGINRGGRLVISDQEFEAEYDYDGDSLFTSPLTPTLFKYGVPAILIMNVVMFVIGDTGDAAIINIEATALGVDFSFDNFLALSVISSTVKLWEGGAYLLSFMLFTLSIFFPYFKLFCLFISWFMPPQYMSTRARGRILSTLDILGKWSFVEFFFLLFVLITFDIQGTSPLYPYLPEEPLLYAALIIEPQLSLFTFGLAVVISLIMGNICLIFHERILNQKRLEWRRRMATKIEEIRKQSTGIAVDEDDLKISVTQWEFTIIPNENEPYTRYVLHITSFGISFLGVISLVTLILLLLASILEAVVIEQYGLVAYLIEFSGNPTSYTLSAIDMLRLSLEKGLNPVTLLLILVLVGTLTIIPLIQLGLSNVIILKSTTLSTARKLYEAYHILKTWCCIDVFVFAIAFACLEVGVISTALIDSVEQCEDIGDFMQETLEPLGIITERDAAASCFALIAIPRIGGFIGVAAVVCFNVLQYYVAHIAHLYIEDRSRVEVDLLREGNTIQIEQGKKTTWHRVLRVLGLIRFTKKKRQVVSSAISLGTGAEEEVDTKLSNPLFQKNTVTEKARKKIENKAMQVERAEKYDMLHPRNKLLNDLTLFLRKIDPEREYLAESLVEEAFSRPGGLQRLSEKLLEKYGATVPIDL